jgi:GH25 family lysozyme M1 (1,4-beta-N-acetylmuramidase)
VTIATSRMMQRALAVALALATFVGTAGGSSARADDPAFADDHAGSSLTAGTPSAPTVVAQPPDSLAGIDVSHWQETIDWTQVAASGVSFVIAKATEGRTFVDPMYASYKADAMANGLAFTAYHFAQPDDTAGDAIAEADHFVDTAQLGPGNLIPALDLERTGGLTQTQLTQWILDWLGRVTERLGVRPMVYTSPNGWLNRTGDTTAVVDAGYTVLWVAHWNVASPTVPAADWGGYGWTFWQWTDCASVPGITGCVDADWHAGTSLDAVTIASPDITPPTALITTPGGLGRPALVAFSEPVHDVTAGNVLLWQPDAAAAVPTTLGCLSGKGVDVDCSAGPVRTAMLQPQEPLVAGQTYSVVVDPTGVLPAVVDRAGNPVAATQQDFTAPTDVEENSPGVVYAWRSVRNRHAFGRSYATEHLRGAAFAMSFPGRSITWYTATGPAQGRAEVFIDGRSRGVFDQYAPRADFKVARRFSGLPRGWHTIEIEVLGTQAKPATDSQVAVDAFALGSQVIASPTGTATWRRVRVAGASGAVALTDTTRASATFVFRGTSVDWYTVRGPSQGRAAMYVDGTLIRTVDNYAATPTTGVVRSVTGLLEGVHTLRIVALGQARPKAQAAFVSIDRLVVTP